MRVLYGGAALMKASERLSGRGVGGVGGAAASLTSRLGCQRGAGGNALRLEEPSSGLCWRRSHRLDTREQLRAAAAAAAAEFLFL